MIITFLQILLQLSNHEGLDEQGVACLGHKENVDGTIILSRVRGSMTNNKGFWIR
jgi:hypothetical protein